MYRTTWSLDVYITRIQVLNLRMQSRSVLDQSNHVLMSTFSKTRIQKVLLVGWMSFNIKYYDIVHVWNFCELIILVSWIGRSASSSCSLWSSVSSFWSRDLFTAQFLYFRLAAWRRTLFGSETGSSSSMDRHCGEILWLFCSGWLPRWLLYHRFSDSFHFAPKLNHRVSE